MVFTEYSTTWIEYVNFLERATNYACFILIDYFSMCHSNWSTAYRRKKQIFTSFVFGLAIIFMSQYQCSLENGHSMHLGLIFLLCSEKWAISQVDKMLLSEITFTIAEEIWALFQRIYQIGEFAFLKFLVVSNLFHFDRKSWTSTLYNNWKSREWDHIYTLLQITINHQDNAVVFH